MVFPVGSRVANSAVDRGLSEVEADQGSHPASVSGVITPLWTAMENCVCDIWWRDRVRSRLDLFHQMHDALMTPTEARVLF